MSRPYFSKSIEELEKLEEETSEIRGLEILIDELNHRKTNLAQMLASNIQKKLKSPSNNNAILEKESALPLHSADSSIHTLDLETLYKKNTENPNDPTISRLSCWTALEALSPQTYKKPDDLGTGDKYCIAMSVVK